MECGRAREAISAILDGEDPGLDPAEVQAHLVGCAGCRAWREAAHRVTRRARLTPATPVTDRGEAIVAAVLAARGLRRPGRRRCARLGLAGVAATQLAFAVPVLLFGLDHGAPMHLAHELGSFDLALAVGFLAAALRPGRAVGMLALVGVAAVALLGTAAADLAGRHTDVVDEVPHLLAVAGWVLLWLLAGTENDMNRPGGAVTVAPASLSRRRWRLELERWGRIGRRGPAAQSSATPSPAAQSPAAQSPATPSPAAQSPATPSPGRSRLPGRVAVLLGLAVLGVLVAPRPASAHAILGGTDPPSGVVLSAPPGRVSLSFGEPVTVAATGVHVYDDHLHPVEVDPSGHPTGAPDTVGVALAPGLPAGTYTVTWRVISADSHPVSGGFTFSIGHPSTVVAAVADQSGGSPLVGLLLGATRLAGFVGLVLGLGAAAVLWALWPAGRSDRRARLLVRAGWWLLAGGGLGGLLVQGPYGAGLSIDHLLDPGLLAGTVSTRFGAVSLARLALLVPLEVALAVLLRGGEGLGKAEVAPRPGPAVLVTGLLAAVGVLVTFGLAGHAGTGSQVPLTMASDVVHLAAMAAWLGGLALLATCLLGRRRATQLAAVLPAFSRWAAAAVLAIVVTGSYQSWRDVGALAAFPTTGYGRLLMAKIAAFLVLVALGNLARRWIHRHYLGPPRARLLAPRLVAHAAAPPTAIPSTAGDEQQPPTAADVTALRRGLAGEVLVGLVVLVLTALLVNTAQAAETYAPTYTTTQATSSTVLTATVDPAHTGPAIIRLATRSPDGAAQPIVAATGSLSLPAQHVGPLPIAFAGNASPVSFPVPGPWVLDVTVQTSPSQATSFRITIPVT